MPVSADADAVLGLAFIAVPAQVAVKAVDEFVDALVLVVAVVVELLFEPAEEALGGVIGATQPLALMNRVSPWCSQMRIHSGQQ